MKFSKHFVFLSLFTIVFGLWSYYTIASGTTTTANTVWMHNIHHTVNDKTVHLTREVTTGNNQADMFIWTPDTQVFKLINTIDVFKKETSLQIQGDGNYVVRFIPLGGGNDIRYTFAISWAKLPEKDINVVPKTGTKENLLLILAFSILVYTIYRWRKSTKTYK